MPILKGALSVRRYSVSKDLAEGWREQFSAALVEHAFRDPGSKTKKEPTLGWVSAHNLLDTPFDDVTTWLYNQYALFHLRVDKKVLPARLFRATLQKRLAAWCDANKRERCPPGVREEIQAALEVEMLKQTLPRVQVYEVCWNVAEGYVLFHNDSETVNDTFRKLFMRTFSLTPMPWSPLHELPDLALGDALLSAGSSDLRGPQ